MFKEPVDPVALGIPDYFKVVKKPMDFSTINEKLKFNEYKTIQEFIDDINLIFTNWKLYNGENSSYGMAANALTKIFEKQWEKLGIEYYK